MLSLTMAPKTNPLHVQRFGIVLVMGLYIFCCSTMGTGALRDFTITQAIAYGVTCLCFFWIALSVIARVFYSISAPFRPLRTFVFVFVNSIKTIVTVLHIVFGARFALVEVAITHLGVSVEFGQRFDLIALEALFCRGRERHGSWIWDLVGFGNDQNGMSPPSSYPKSSAGG